MKKYLFPIIMLAIFEMIAVTLWLVRDNLFYLFNFSYIGCSIALGIFLFIRKYKNARRVFGTICLQVYLKQQPFIMRLLKFLDHCSLAEAGADMPAGQQ